MRLLLVFILTPVAYSQGLLGGRIQIGAVGGVPLTEGLRNIGYGKSESKPYLVGPSVEVRIHGGFAIEIDAIYRRLGASGSYSILLPGRNLVDVTAETQYANSFRTRMNSWELPVLAKYTFKRDFGGLHPFLGTGYAFRTSWEQSQYQSTNSSNPINYSSDTRGKLGVGAVVAAGVSFKVGPMKLTPQFRYTRWGEDSSSRRRADQADFMIGLHF